MIVILDGDKPIRCFADEDKELADCYYSDLKAVEGENHIIHKEMCPLAFGKIKKVSKTH